MDAGSRRKIEDFRDRVAKLVEEVERFIIAEEDGIDRMPDADRNGDLGAKAEQSLGIVDEAFDYLSDAKRCLVDALE